MRLQPAVLASILLFSCGSDPDPKNNAKDPMMEPSPMIVGPEGGTISFDRITVEIPSGALTATVAITVAATDRPLEGIGPWYELGPAGIVFELPVRVSIALLDGELATGELPVMSKYISHPAYEGSGEASGYLVLESSFDEGTRRVTGETIGFSRIGVRIVPPSCPEISPPIITESSWDPCTRRITFGWESESPVFVEFGYRQGYGQPVRWVWGWNTTLRSHRVELPVPVAPPGPGQSAYTFVYKMHAVYNCSGTNLLSGDVVAEVPAYEILPPDPPTDLSATRSRDDRISISWRRPRAPESQEDGYQLSRSPGWSTAGLRDVGDVTTYDDLDDLTAGTAYVYYVRAYHSSCGFTRYSRWLQGSTSGSISAPAPVGAVTATALSSGAVRIEWSLVESAAEYVVRRTGGDGSFSDVILQHPATSYEDITVEPGTTYTYSVNGVNAAGAGGEASATVTTPEVMMGEATCGDLKLSVTPVQQTMRVQPDNCAPSCPPDAVFEIHVERLNGVTSDVQLFARGDAWQLIEFYLGTLGSTLLTGGVPMETSSLTIRAPAYALAGEVLPATWNLEIAAAYRDDSRPMACVVPVQLVIEP